MFPSLEIHSDDANRSLFFDRCYICGNYEDPVVLKNRADPPKWDRDFREHNRKTLASAQNDYLMMND